MLTLAALALASGLPLVVEGVPQIKDANAYFEADAIAGDVDGVVLCRVDVIGSRSWDTFGAVDLAVTLSAGDQRFEMWGDEDRANTFVSAPAVHLKKGTKLTVVVEDRDLTGREPVARGHAVFDGTSLAFDLDETQIACRTVPAKRAAARAQPHVKRAEQRVAQLARAKVDLRGISAGWNVLDEFAVAGAVRDATAWTGETDATRALLASAEKAQQAFASSLLAAARSLPATSSGQDARARFALSGTSLTVTALIDNPGLVRVDVVDDEGAIVAVSVADAFVTASLLKGQSTTIALPARVAAKDVVVVRAGVSAGDMVPLKR